MNLEEQNLNEAESPQLNIGAVMPSFFFAFLFRMKINYNK
jgi:hypothetical protein